MGQQNTGGFGVAHPVPYSPEPKAKETQEHPGDNMPSDYQPPGVDEEVDYNSLEEALMS